MKEYTLTLNSLELCALDCVIKEFRREHGYNRSIFSDETLEIMKKIKEICENEE